MSDRYRETFREEALEILAELESALLELEENPDDPEVIGRVFRAMHTIKGAGAMAGFDDVAGFTHEVETVFEVVRQGKLAVTTELVNLTLASRDLIKAMIDGDFGKEEDLEKSGKIIAGLRQLLPRSGAAGQDKPSSPQAGKGGDQVTYRIRFRPTPEIFRKGLNPLCLMRELNSLGDCRVVAQIDQIPTLAELDPEVCYTYWDIVLTSDQGTDAIRDVFIFVEDDCELKIEVIDDGGFADTDSTYKKLGEILVERGDLSQRELRAILADKERIGDLLVQRKLVDGIKIESALVEQQRVQDLRRERQASDNVSSVRVRSEKLDSLVNLIGELVTVQARLSQTAAGRNDPEILGIAEEVERLTWDLRDQVLNIRMLPIGTTFSKFKRLVRDLAEDLDKDVELVTEGAETELDKTVIERLNDPLVHLIRNCLDHGIENPAERLRQGKPRKGTIHLSATPSGANVLLQVRDDGAGLDLDLIRRKAVDLGLVAASAEVGDRDLANLIFTPGFSTAREVTNVSGRGVGMDVVRQAISGLRGSIDISSSAGRGTCFTIKLPLTLAIIDGLLVEIGGENFVMALSAVEECIELRGADIARTNGRNLVNVRDEIIPYIKLRDRFEISGEVPEIQQVVIANLEGKRIGFVVDQVIGEHQTVIKSLGRLYRHLSGLSGATILGDGTVALILDLQQLMEQEELAEAQVA